MQEDGPGAAMLVIPTVKARATDFSIAAIMARGPRAERRTTCGAATATAAQHTVGLPTLGKFAAFCSFIRGRVSVPTVRVKTKVKHHIERNVSVVMSSAMGVFSQDMFHYLDTNM
jgi:hypothetical protein